jgi:hypothetical protein
MYAREKENGEAAGDDARLWLVDPAPAGGRARGHPVQVPVSWVAERYQVRVVHARRLAASVLVSAGLLCGHHHDWLGARVLRVDHLRLRHHRRVDHLQRPHTLLSVCVKFARDHTPLSR